MDRRCVVATPQRGRRRGLARPSTDDQPDIRLDSDTLRAVWRRASLARGWRTPGDWWTPPVDTVVAAVAGDESLAEPCAGLGAARAEAGVGLPEAFDDLWALFSILHRLPPAFVIRRFAESYAESAPEAQICTEGVDPLTGLVRVDYLRARLCEVYEEAAAHGVQTAARHGLVSVRFEPLPFGWHGLSRQLTIGRVLHTTFCSGETVASVCPTVMAVLTRHDTSVVPADLGANLSRTSGSDVLVRRIRLPATLPGALMQLDVLAESDRPESPHK